MALHGLRSLRSVLQNRFPITEWGIGNRESGMGNRESGMGNRESRIGNRESGSGKLSGVSQAFFLKVVD